MSLIVVLAGISAADSLPHSVLAAARESASPVQSYDLFADVYRALPWKNAPRDIPTRPTPLPAVDTNAASHEFVEDRYDPQVGRSIVKFDGSGEQARPVSALMIPFKESDTATRVGIVNSGRDLLWMMRPRFAGFDLLEMLDSHPDVSLASDDGLLSVEVPVTSLHEYSEFGARLRIDPNRDHAITGVELYVNVQGRERLINRTDIELVKLDNGRWLPTRARQWEVTPPVEMGEPPIPFGTEIVFHWDRSRYGAALHSSEIDLTSMKEPIRDRMEMRSGGNLILYDYKPDPLWKDPTTLSDLKPESRFRRLLIIANLVLVAVLAILLAYRRLRTR